MMILTLLRSVIREAMSMKHNLKGYSEIIAVTTPSIFIKSEIFQTDNQPTVGTNVTMVTDNHNIRQHDSLYILVE